MGNIQNTGKNTSVSSGKWRDVFGKDSSKQRSRCSDQATAWTVRGSNPGIIAFPKLSDGLWGPPSLHLTRRLRMGGAAPPHPLYAFIACKGTTSPSSPSIYVGNKVSVLHHQRKICRRQSNKDRLSALKWQSHPNGVGAKIVDAAHAKIWKLWAREVSRCSGGEWSNG
jgi:hypothetical protein